MSDLGKTVCPKHQVAYERTCPWCETADVVLPASGDYALDEIALPVGGELTYTADWTGDTD